MKIYIPNTSTQSIGGGWTFRRNLMESFKVMLASSEDKLIFFVENMRDSDIVLITGATMTSREEIKEAKALGKKVVFRIDNMPKDSRNRGTAFSRMKDFGAMADWIVFQSEWAKDYVGWWLKYKGINIENKSSIIYNGANPQHFFEDEKIREKGQYLFVHYNRDENKRAPEAFYMFHQARRKDSKVRLWLVGQFSPELMNYHFDFFADEDVSYLGVIEDPAQMGAIMRTSQYLLFPAYADAAPNTVLEALNSGCEILGVNPVGGSQEMLALKGRTIYDMSKEYADLFYKIL